MGVDVGWKRVPPLELRVGNPAVLHSEALQGPRPAGQLPVHLHGRLVQDLCEEAGSCGDYGDRDRGCHRMDSLKNRGGQREDGNAPPPLVVAMTVLDCWLPPWAE